MYTLTSVSEAEFDTLADIWEASVRATHDFLAEEDFQFFRGMVRSGIFREVTITGLRDASGQLLGFSGTHGTSLEMLFLRPDIRGKGAGKLLLLHAIENQGITHVDVNEQNPLALGFYRHFGFDVVRRSEVDGTGKPYPILHLVR
ncbi:MAG: GNAT family N-acetyltransferase [Siphonobacter aquaeclarae]|nr:GNAT family N-acetyltransferase [Siphonobacter aquaeclarae]